MNAYELADKVDLEPYGIYGEQAANMLRQQADRIAELEKETHSINYTCPNCETHVELFYKTPQIKELSDEEIKKCVIAWVKQIYGNEYVTPLDSHIINGTKLIRLVEKRIFKNDSL
jgi:hypothetical protein